MSVAFRRESDDEHLEPRFELPIPAGPNRVTPRGLRLIEQQVATLEAAHREDAPAERVAEIGRELRYWRTRLATAEVAPPASGDEAAIGTRVHFRLGGRPRTIEIVGHDEADPAAGRIAFAAPLAQALIGAGAGERVDFGDRAEAIEIISVEPIAD